MYKLFVLKGPRSTYVDEPYAAVRRQCVNAVRYEMIQSGTVDMYRCRFLWNFSWKTEWCRVVVTVCRFMLPGWNAVKHCREIFGWTQAERNSVWIDIERTRKVVFFTKIWRMRGITTHLWNACWCLFNFTSTIAFSCCICTAHSSICRWDSAKARSSSSIALFDRRSLSTAAFSSAPSNAISMVICGRPCDLDRVCIQAFRKKRKEGLAPFLLLFPTHRALICKESQTRLRLSTFWRLVRFGQTTFQIAPLNFFRTTIGRSIRTQRYFTGIFCFSLRPSMTIEESVHRLSDVRVRIIHRYYGYYLIKARFPQKLITRLKQG